MKDLEYILWKDAVSVDPWTHIDEIEPTYHMIETFGILVAENEESIVVGLNHDTESDNYSCFIHIPKPMIVSRHPMRVGSLGSLEE